MLLVDTSKIFIALPKLLWRRKIIIGQDDLFPVVLFQPVMKNETISVGRKNKWNHQALGIIQRLLHSCPKSMVIVFGFNNCKRLVGLMEKHVIGKLGFFTFA